jgi:hypothetical protein
MSVAGDVPAFGVAPRQQGFAIFGAEGQYHDAEFLAAPAGSVLAPIQVGTHGDTLRFASYFDRWGYVHLFRNQNGKMAELDTYAIPQAHDPASPWVRGPRCTRWPRPPSGPTWRISPTTPVVSA